MRKREKREKGREKIRKRDKREKGREREEEGKRLREK